MGWRANTWCPRCKQHRPGEFGFHTHNIKGTVQRNSYCKDCNREYQREDRRINGERRNAAKRAERAPRIYHRPVSRFLDKVRQEGECWIWTGAYDRGYGFYRNIRAHRWAYEDWRGYVPERAHFVWTCGRQGCVNPAHLELTEASKRRINAGVPLKEMMK